MDHREATGEPSSSAATPLSSFTFSLSTPSLSFPSPLPPLPASPPSPSSWPHRENPSVRPSQDETRPRKRPRYHARYPPVSGPARFPYLFRVRTQTHVELQRLLRGRLRLDPPQPTFLGLPAEVRAIIFRELFTGVALVHTKKPLPQEDTSLAILLVNRQISAEASRQLLACAEFHFYDFRGAVGMTALQRELVRYVTLQEPQLLGDLPSMLPGLHRLQVVSGVIEVARERDLHIDSYMKIAMTTISQLFFGDRETGLHSCVFTEMLRQRLQPARVPVEICWPFALGDEQIRFDVRLQPQTAWELTATYPTTGVVLKEMLPMPSARQIDNVSKYMGLSVWERTVDTIMVYISHRAKEFLRRIRARISLPYLLNVVFPVMVLVVVAVACACIIYLRRR